MLHNVCDIFVHVYAFLLMSTSAVRPGLEPTIPVVLSECTSNDPACRKLEAEAAQKQKLAAKNASKKFPVTASALAFVQPWYAFVRHVWKDARAASRVLDLETVHRFGGQLHKELHDTQQMCQEALTGSLMFAEGWEALGQGGC